MSVAELSSIIKLMKLDLPSTELAKLIESADADRSGSMSNAIKRPPGAERVLQPPLIQPPLLPLPMLHSRSAHGQLFDPVTPGVSFIEFAALVKQQQASGGAGGLAEIVTQADSMFGWGFLNPASSSAGAQI